MNIRLPTEVLGTSQSKSSALGRYFTETLQAKLSESNTQPVDRISSSLVLGALTAAMLPFDPHEVVSIELQEPMRSLRGAQHWTLLEAALHIATPENPQAPKRDWPADIAAFNSNLHDRHEGARSHLRSQRSPINGEWLAAALVAAGCNPWTGAGKTPRPSKPGKDEVPASVSQMIRLGYAGLLQRSLELPGAHTAQQVWDGEAIVGTKTSDFLVKEGSLHILEVLLDKGARPRNESELVRLLSIATVEAVDVLKSRLDLDLSPKAAKRVIDAWAERRKGEEVGTEDLARMSALIDKDVNVDQAYVEIKVTELLASPWGVRPNGSQAMAYDFMREHEPETLATRTRKKGGQSAGEWSVLAAAAFARTRQAGDEGALGWSVAEMISRRRDLEGTPTPHDFGSAPLKGCLEDAVGFDWRPGISINGVVALSLLGQRAGAHDHNVIGRAKLEKLEKDWRDFELATGITNKNEWAVKHAQDAADFTLTILKNPGVAQAQAMFSTWETALLRNPGMARAIAPDTAASLLQALTANFRGALEPPRVERVFRALFPHLPHNEASADVDASLKGAEYRAHLVTVLSNADHVVLDIIERNFQYIPSDCMDLIEHGIKAVGGTPSQVNQTLARFEEWKMSRALPPAPSRAPTPGRRF